MKSNKQICACVFYLSLRRININLNFLQCVENFGPAPKFGHF